ncbi:MAG: hypothetical protein JW717_08725 [Marinilabiliaceae bacterium]|nr:hypothetical protein [Marinilabiliaceae bacterium]
MPIILEHTLPSGSIIGVWKLDEPSESLIQQIHLHKSEQLQIQGFKLENRKREWLAIRALLQHFLGSKCHIVYSPAGKPYLHNPEYHIGITHTKGYACIILNRMKPVSIDIEKPGIRVLKISDRFMNEYEYKIDHSFSEEIFKTIIWCSKEAMYKWGGETDVIFKDQLIINSIVTVNKNELDIFSTLKKDNISIDLSLRCWIKDEYVLVFTS